MRVADLGEVGVGNEVVVLVVWDVLASRTLPAGRAP
jgi:hypothetical protein